MSTRAVSTPGDSSVEPVRFSGKAREYALIGALAGFVIGSVAAHYLFPAGGSNLFFSVTTGCGAALLGGAVGLFLIEDMIKKVKEHNSDKEHPHSN